MFFLLIGVTRQINNPCMTLTPTRFHIISVDTGQHKCDICSQTKPANSHMWKDVIKGFKEISTSTICSFWWITQAERSILEVVFILGSRSDSSQHQRISRTKSIHKTAIAGITNSIINIAHEIKTRALLKILSTEHEPRILQLPNHNACKQNWAKRESEGAPFKARPYLFSAST